MVWVALGCMLGGFAVGWISRSALSVTLTSAQIVLFALALLLAEQIDWEEAFFWSVGGLFSHQAAFLAAVILRTWREDRREAARSPSVADQIVSDLAEMDTLAADMPRKAPQVAPEAKDIRALIAHIRRLLDHPLALETLLRERQKGRGFPAG